MSDLTLLTKILRLKDLKITACSFQQRDTELHRWVKPFKIGCRCPKCERRCPIVREARGRSGPGRMWPSWVARSCFGTPPRRSPVRPMGSCRRESPGRPPVRVPGVRRAG